MGLDDILKPKTEEEVYNSAVAIDDPDELLRLAVSKINDPKLIKLALERGADPNKVARNLNSVKDPILIKTLLENIKNNLDINLIVLKGIKMGFEDLIIKLIDKGKIDPSKKSYIMLVWAIGYEHTMKKLVTKLLNDKRIDPKQEKESIAEAIAVAIGRGNNEILKILLNDKRIDPSADHNRAIKTAAQYGNLEAVKLLLKDKRVNPFEDEYPLSIAKQKMEEETDLKEKNTYKKIIDILLKYHDENNK